MTIKFISLCRFKKPKEKSVSLAKKDSSVLSLLHTIDTDNNECQENIFFTHHYYIKNKGYVKHIYIKIYWYCRNFTHHWVSAEWYETRGRKTIMYNYHYGEYTNLGFFFEWTVSVKPVLRIIIRNDWKTVWHSRN